MRVAQKYARQILLANPTPDHLFIPIDDWVELYNELDLSLTDKQRASGMFSLFDEKFPYKNILLCGVPIAVGGVK